MPIEVRELIIKAVVGQEAASGNAQAAGGANNSVSANEEMINSCVEKVLEIIKEKMER
jgi:hypothetical protein